MPVDQHPDLHTMPGTDTVEVRTPSTIGNFGPGFDVTALGLAWGGDTVRLTPDGEDHVTVTGAGADAIPRDWEANCATAALDHLRDHAGVDQRFHVEIEKGIEAGSGLGSSASSSAGGALALARFLAEERTFDAAEIVEAAAAGEARVAGAHADDVAAAVLGGLAMVRGSELHRVQPPDDLRVALAVPRLRLETRIMRKAVGEHVRVTDAVANLANVALLVDAMHRGDVAAVGRCLEDRIAAPGRKRYVPYHDAVVEAALEAGAYGAAMSGSGPSMFAVTDDPQDAERVAGAMRDAVVETGVEAEAATCQAETRVVMDEVLLR